MMDAHELANKLQDETDGENAEIGVYDEDGALYLIYEVDGQGGNGAPVSIKIRKVDLS